MSVDSNYFSITEVVAGSAPAYMSGMSAYDVVSLSSVQNYSTIEAAVLGETPWTDGGSPASNGHIEAIVNAWCGGAADPSGHRLFLQGGGHGDGACNAIVVCDFSGDTPAGFDVVAGSWSDPSIVPPSSSGTNDAYTDGRAAASHTYHALVYDPTSDQFVRVGGAPWGGGSFTDATWTYSALASTSPSSRWTRRGDYPGSFGTRNTLVINTSAQKALHVWATGGGFVQWAFYNIATNTWGNNASTGFAYAGSTDTSAVFDENRNQILVFDTSQGPVCRLHSIDWSAETLSASSLSLSGSVTGDGAFLYDPTRQSIWHLGASFSQIKELTTSDGATYTAATNSLSAAYTSNVGAGLFSRAVLLDDYRAIGVVGWYTESARVIKLP